MNLMEINAGVIKVSIKNFIRDLNQSHGMIYINKKQWGWEIDIHDSDMTNVETRELEDYLTKEFEESFKVMNSGEDEDA